MCSGLRNCDCSNGFHRLNRHRDAEKQPGDDVVEGSEDKRRAEIKIIHKSESKDNRDVGPKIPDRATKFRPYSGLQSEARRVIGPSAVAARSVAGEEWGRSI